MEAEYCASKLVLAPPCLQRLPAKVAMRFGQQIPYFSRNVVLRHSIPHGIGGIVSRMPQPSRMRAVLHMAANIKDRAQNPDIDDIDVSQYSSEELGLEDDEDIFPFQPDDLDPEGRDLRLEDFYTVKEGTPQSLIYELYSDDIYGPPVSSATPLHSDHLFRSVSDRLYEIVSL